MPNNNSLTNLDERNKHIAINKAKKIFKNPNNPVEDNEKSYNVNDNENNQWYSDRPNNITNQDFSPNENPEQQPKKDTGHHNIFINTNDKQQKDEWKKPDKNTAHIQANDNVFSSLNLPQQQYQYLLNLIEEFNKLDVSFNSILNKRDETIKKKIEETEQTSDEKIKKCNNLLEKLKPLDQELSIRSNDYENFLIKILNRVSITDDGKIQSSLDDFIANIQDVTAYANKLLPQINDKDTFTALQKDLGKLNNYLIQAASMASSIAGTLDAVKSSRQILNKYNTEYNTRGVWQSIIDYIKNFFASFFNMFSYEHSYAFYNDKLPKLQHILEKLNSPNLEEAKKARADFIKLYEQLLLEKTYTIGYELPITQFKDLSKIKELILNESNNIDNTELLTQLIKIGGKFKLENVMQNIGTKNRDKFMQQMEKFVSDNILPDNIDNKAKYAKEFLQQTELKKIEDIADEEKDKLENVWNGLIGKNNLLFTKKKYDNDAKRINANLMGYKNRLVQDKIDIITATNLQCWKDYLNLCKTHIHKYNSLVDLLNVIQENTNLNVGGIYKEKIDKIKNRLNPEAFKKELLQAHKLAIDISNEIMTKQDLKQYLELANSIKDKLSDETKKYPSSGSVKSYEEIAEQIRSVKAIQDYIKDSTNMIEAIKFDKIKESDFSRVKPKRNTIPITEAVKQMYSNNGVISTNLIELYKAMKPEYIMPGRGEGGRGGGFPPY